MRVFSYKILFLFVLLIFLIGCSANTFPKPDIKDDFCGVHINYQYCKCAFHNEYCESISMSKSDANKYVQAEYTAWVDEQYNAWQAACKIGGGIPDDNKCLQKYGVNEKNGNLYLNSKPGEILSLNREDLPQWARDKIATVGASIAVVGPPDTIMTGDEKVLLDGRPIARVNDTTAHGGYIVEGSNNIFVNGRPVAIIGSYAIDPMVAPGAVPHVGGPISTNGD